MPALPSVIAAVGSTPLVRLARIAAGCPATVLAKVEAANPGGSAKDRVGVALLDDAQRRGVLAGREIIEPTSGNTGIALALAAAARGMKLTLTMPEGATPERRRLLAAFGAKLILTPDSEGMAGSIRRAEEIVRSDPEKYFLPQQFRNPANPAAHEAGTGPEIWAAAGGAVDAIVAAVGTGGTLTGTARFLKKVSPAVTAVAVEPAGSPVITQFLAGQTLSPGPHAIPGIGAGFVPENLDLRIVDRVETVTDEEAARTARRLAREEGLLAGPSSGAAVAAALRLAREEAFAGRTIVAVLPDSGERYLSAGLFDG